MILNASTLPGLAAELLKVAEKHAARVPNLVTVRIGNYKPADLEQAAYCQAVALIASDYATYYESVASTPQAEHRHISALLVELYEEIGRGGGALNAKQRAQREVLTALFHRLLVLARAADRQQQAVVAALDKAGLL